MGDSFDCIIHTTLAGGLKQSPYVREKKPVQSGQAGVGGAPLLFCKNYQRGTCSFTEDHNGNFDGKVKFLKHMCAKCWLETRKVEKHPEGSNLCTL